MNSGNDDESKTIRPHRVSAFAEAAGEAPSGSSRIAAEAGGKGEVEEETEETRNPKVGRVPQMPTKFEMEEHLPLHIPYRPWCPVCVAGEGVQNQSRQATPEEKGGCGVTISMDYCFLSSDDGEEGDPKVLVVHDDKSEALWALAVKAKGIGAPEVSAWVAQKLEEAGYRGMPVTTNNGPRRNQHGIKGL